MEVVVKLDEPFRAEHFVVVNQRIDALNVFGEELEDLKIVQFFGCADPLDTKVKKVQLSGFQGLLNALLIKLVAGLEVLPVADPQQKGNFLRQRWLKLKQLHGELTPSDLYGPMGYFSKGNSLLILKFHPDGIADIVLGFFVVLHLAAGPICVYFDPEVLVLLEVVVDLEGQVVLTVPQQDLQ